MRILSRPMFKYGGPIREGVMHGMRNNYASGQRVGAFNVGSPVKGMFPKDVTGREHHIAPAVGAGIWYGAQGLARLAPMLYRAITGAKNISKGANLLKNVGTTYRNVGGVGSGTGWSTIPRSTVGKEIVTVPGKTQAGGALNTIKNWFKADPLYSSVAGGTTALGRGIKWTGKKGLEFGKYATTTPSGLAFFGIPVVYAGGKYILSSTGEELKGDQLDQITQEGEKWSPGVGGKQYDPSTSPSAMAAAAKKARTAKLAKYMDTMGYDKAKKSAMGDALIDASAIVQAGTEEGGSLKHADWSKMINQAIQTTSKRLDKPEQIREAVGLMMTKADIQKDMTAEENALAKLLTSKKIEKLNKELEGNSFRENLVAVTKQMPGQEGIDTAVRLTEGKDFRGNIINVSDFNKILKDMKKESGLDDKTIIEEYTQQVISKNPDKFDDGHYTVGNNLVTIKDDIVVAVE